jgi:hypothetical protein
METSNLSFTNQQMSSFGKSVVLSSGPSLQILDLSQDMKACAKIQVKPRNYVSNANVQPLP